jgi:hypothetical protein
MSQENVEVVRRAYEAFNRGGPEAVIGGRLARAPRPARAHNPGLRAAVALLAPIGRVRGY